MIKNYFKITFRQLFKYKAFSAINILGLAFSMSICLLIILLIKDAHSFDLFHVESDQIYRVVTTPERKDGSSEPYATSPYLVGETMLEDYAQVETWTPLINTLSGTIDKKIAFKGLFTSPSFFEMFGFEMTSGNPSTALNEPFSIVLTKELSQKLFKKENPIGKEINISGYSNLFKVTGVLKDFPGKTHLEFEALSSITTQFALEKNETVSSVTDTWHNYYSCYNFVRLNNLNDSKKAELALADIVNTKYKGLELEARDMGYQFTLQPLNEITPGSIMSNSMGRGMPSFLIWFLTVLGLVIILSACFNYTNLTIARSFARTKEIGVRKTMGASKTQVFWQFISEAIATSLLSFGIAFLLLKGLKPLFLQLNFTSFIDLDLTEGIELYILFLLFAISVGFIAGLLPAMTLSKISPQRVLQNLKNVRLIKRMGVRKVLLVVQFAVTLIFFITVTIAWQQINHATKNNFGFSQPKTLLVDIQGESYNKALTAFSQVSGVDKISAISFPMGTWEDASVNVRMEAEDEKIDVRDYFIDENYLSHFDIDLIAGENFPKNLSQQNELFTIVNERFVKQFELGQPEDAIGKSIIIGNDLNITIQGVVADFLFKPTSYAIEPLLLRYDPSQLGTLNLSLITNDPLITLTSLERTWGKLNDAPFQAEFFDARIKENYSNVTDIIWMVSFIAMMSMIISCMGLLGLAIFLAKAKAKEMSIRKVMGASAKDVLILLTKNHLLLLGIATGIAIPISYLIGAQLLQVFAIQIPLSIKLFLPGILILLLVVMLTTGVQTLKAALSNPVDSLKDE